MADAADASDAEVTRLAFDLVPGVSVQVDDGEILSVPLEPLEIAAGEHMITARHRCGQESTIHAVVANGETKTLGHADFPGMASATLRLKISALHGQTLAPTLRTGLADDGKAVADIEHPISDSGEARLLACRQRIMVGSGHPDVGGYWEDLDVEPGEVIERTLVLAPGPDMVRLPGGDFVMGMRTETLEEIERDNHDPNNDEGEGTWFPIPQRKVRLQPFEIDRHPVTAAQFKACWGAGACKWDGEQVLESSRDPFQYCAHEPPVDVSPWEWPRIPRAQMADYPVNCVARWEAEKYCKWVKKRLPTPDEWEFAGRNGRSDWDCPSRPPSDRFVCGKFGTAGGYGGANDQYGNRAVCGVPEDSSGAGVCEIGRMSELVLDDEKNGGPDCGTYEGPKRSSGSGAWEEPICEEDGRRSPSSTFRCARSTER